MLPQTVPRPHLDLRIIKTGYIFLHCRKSCALPLRHILSKQNCRLQEPYGNTFAYVCSGYAHSYPDIGGLSAGAPLTPSPVIAVICLFLPGIHYPILLRLNTGINRVLAAISKLFVDIFEISEPVIAWLSSDIIPSSLAIAIAVSCGRLLS